MKTPLKNLFAALPLLAFSSFALAQEDQTTGLAGYNFEEPAETLWQLPKELKDISGLGLSPDGRLFAIEEERAIFHEIDFTEGKIIKTFSFGRPAAKKGFEGFTIAGKRFFIINKKGLMLEGREGFNGEGKVFNAHDTEFGNTCETGGLATMGDKVLILCRKAKDKALNNHLTIFSWNIPTKSSDENPFLNIPLSSEGFPPELADIQPSSLEVLENGNFLILSAGKKLVFEITPEGSFVGMSLINKKWHNNPEGIVMTPDGQLIISDEGSPATIQVYKK